MTAFSGNWFQRRAARRRAAAEAYRGLLHHALEPVHYSAAGVPDTFEGRAGMVTLLTSLACVRLSAIPGREPARLIERLNDLVLDGFDAAYREKGVGDASIARKVRKLAQGHAGLGKAVFAVLTDPAGADPAASIEDILRRNGLAPPDKAPVLTRSALALQAHLARQPDAEILQGRFDWIGASAGQPAAEG
ncbi:MAG: ubiquinol-cytochrome C chaperone family protein [Hyphomonas sp.]|nr:ubiquinol-cytochrome C chaperone family protein [Hyphomonas sp.]